eukprot:13196437-Alexandrium_andersonii.AAC.1
MRGDGSFQVVDTGPFVRDPDPHLLAPRFNWLVEVPGGPLEPIRASAFAAAQPGGAAPPGPEALGTWSRPQTDATPQTREPALHHVRPQLPAAPASAAAKRRAARRGRRAGGMYFSLRGRSALRSPSAPSLL